MLGPYRTKRDLRRTPEPPARRKRGAGGLRFVVQKHWARNLHYDLRLEHEGVLKSWAVPKGLSLDPQVKRLAVQVEDHPFAYKDFEGEIPEGNYGAGRVMIWDEGTYAPVGESPAAPRQAVGAALAKGHLDLVFYGKKLRGGFTLVRLQRSSKNWLLIKKHDDFASPDAVLDEGPVRRQRRDPPAPTLKSEVLPQLAGLDLAGARPGGLRHTPEPMLATLIAEPFDAENWIFEVKWDGFRALAQIERGRVRLFSRNHQPLNRRFPAIVESLQTLPVDAVLDGEIVAVDAQGRADLPALQRYLQEGAGEVLYYVFDVLAVGGLDVRPLALRRRRAILAKILPRASRVRESVAVPGQGKAFYQAVIENKLEGMVAKNLDSPYRSGERTQDWLKLKLQHRQEAVIAGFTRPRGGAGRAFGALVLGVHQDGELVFAGHVGTGFDETKLAHLLRKLKPLISRQCPFAQEPETNTPVTWVRPRLVCEVKFEGWTRDGSMRLPVFLGLREDIRPETAVRELPVEAAPAEEKPRALAPTRARLTNLDKVFWPKEGYTKKDLIRYYDRVSQAILPFLKNRPQSLNRQPNGIAEPGFFQKNIEIDPPDWVKTVMVPSEHRGEALRYLVCQNRDTLLYLANLGCIELNVWDSSLPRLDRPDVMVLDFDPVEPGLAHVVQAVLETKKLLDQLDLPGFVKTSGSRGLHVYVPLKPRLDFEQVREFAHMLAAIVSRRNPGLLAGERDPQQRRGLVYLDYPQNRYGATMAAPYALRPRPGAPVSTPLAWSEVTPKLDPLAFTIRTLPKRLDRIGDPWRDMFKVRADLATALSKVEKIVGERK